MSGRPPSQLSSMCGRYLEPNVQCRQTSPSAGDSAHGRLGRKLVSHRRSAALHYQRRDYRRRVRVDRDGHHRHRPFAVRIFKQLHTTLRGLSLGQIRAPESVHSPRTGDSGDNELLVLLGEYLPDAHRHPSGAGYRRRVHHPVYHRARQRPRVEGEPRREHGSLQHAFACSDSVPGPSRPVQLSTKVPTLSQASR